MDQLRSLRVFVRVVGEGSFAGAARALDLAPPVVTRAIAELEEHLGARLLNRTTRRLVLTEIGEAYLERARHLLADLDEADALASQSATQPQGQLRVLAPPAFAVHQLVKHLPRFRQQYPRVGVELSVTGPVDGVDESFDVSILSIGRQTLDGEFVARRLARSEFVACASPDYLKRHGRPQHPDDLLQHEAVLPSVPAVRRELRFRLAHGRGEHVLAVPTPPAALSSSHLESLHAAALAGLGIAGLPSFLVESALRQGTLERVLPQWRLESLTIYAAMPTRQHVPARTRAFVDFLVQAFGGEDRDPWLSTP